MLTIQIMLGEWFQIGEAWVQFVQGDGAIEKRVKIRIEAPRNIAIIRDKAKAKLGPRTPTVVGKENDDGHI